MLADYDCTELAGELGVIRERLSGIEETQRLLVASINGNDKPGIKADLEVVKSQVAIHRGLIVLILTTQLGMIGVLLQVI